MRLLQQHAGLRERPCTWPRSTHLAVSQLRPTAYSRAGPRPLRVACRAEADGAAAQATISAADSVAELNDPALIQASGSHTAKLVDRGGDVGLDIYMQLPAEQYTVVDADMIKYRGGNEFDLVVPRVHFFNLWVQPNARAHVEVTPTQVQVVANNCRLAGSEVFNALNLDGRFHMLFTTEIIWEAAPEGGAGSMTATTHLEVHCEPVGAFRLMPRAVLEGTCNLVLSGLVLALLPAFMNRLSADYEKWAEDAAYRESRALLSVRA